MKPDIQAMTLSEFCDSYRIARSTLYALSKAGRGPEFYKVGRRKFITGAAAERWRLGFETSPRELLRTGDSQAPHKNKTRNGSVAKSSAKKAGAATESRVTNSGRRDSSTPRVGVRAKSRPAPTEAKTKRGRSNVDRQPKEQHAMPRPVQPAKRPTRKGVNAPTLAKTSSTRSKVPPRVGVIGIKKPAKPSPAGRNTTVKQPAGRSDRGRTSGKRVKPRDANGRFLPK